MGKWLLILLAAPIVSWASIPAGDGMPLPWPYPWAKECPIQWQSLSGRYVLSDSSQTQILEIKISVIYSEGIEMVRIAKYDRFNRLVADGYSFLSKDQKTVQVLLNPVDKESPSTWAVIRMYYKSELVSCRSEDLVPILFMQNVGDERNSSRFKLIREETRRRYR